MENFVDTMEGRDVKQELFEAFNIELARELLAETDATEDEKDQVIALCKTPYDAPALFYILRAVGADNFG